MVLPISISKPEMEKDGSFILRLKDTVSIMPYEWFGRRRRTGGSFGRKGCRKRQTNSGVLKITVK